MGSDSWTQLSEQPQDPGREAGRARHLDSESSQRPAPLIITFLHQAASRSLTLSVLGKEVTWITEENTRRLGEKDLNVRSKSC